MSQSFSDFLKSQYSFALPIFNSSLEDYQSIDLSKTNKNLWNQVNPSDPLEMQKYISNYLEKKGKNIAFGGYLEHRNIYDRSAYFKEKENRFIHLGIDFWTNENAGIAAVFDGTIHSFKNNKNFSDYGPTLILEHNAKGFTWFSLYGHLSLDSMLYWQIGKTIASGERIGYLGAISENGNYAPHLHFQIMLNMEGKSGDYPGVTSEKEVHHFQNNCPNPLYLFPELMKM